MAKGPVSSAGGLMVPIPFVVLSMVPRACLSSVYMSVASRTAASKGEWNLGSVWATVVTALARAWPRGLPFAAVVSLMPCRHGIHSSEVVREIAMVCGAGRTGLDIQWLIYHVADVSVDWPAWESCVHTGCTSTACNRSNWIRHQLDVQSLVKSCGTPQQARSRAVFVDSSENEAFKYAPSKNMNIRGDNPKCPNISRYHIQVKTIIAFALLRWYTCDTAQSKNTAQLEPQEVGNVVL